ncbi:MAG: PAS domain S-box protein [Actinomycetes bacterium]
MTGLDGLFSADPPPDLLAIIDAIPAGLCALTLEGRVVAANRAAHAVIGPGTRVGEVLLGRTPRASRANAAEQWRTFIASADPEAMLEIPVAADDGSECWYRVSAHKVLSDDGSAAGVMVVWLDVTELKAAESAAESAIRYVDALMARASDFVTVLEGDGSWRSSSEGGTRILGFPPGFDPPGGVFSLLHPDDVEIARDGFARVLGGSDLVDDPLEVRIGDATGSWRRLELVAANMLDDPVVRGIVINARDVTARRLIEHDLRSSEERYRELVERLDEGIWVTDLAGVTEFVNPRMAEMLMMVPEAMVGTAVTDYLDPLWVDQARVRFERWDLEPSPRRELRLLRADGRSLWASLSSSIIREDGSPPRVVGVVSDITGPKKLEERLEEARRQAVAESRAKTDMLARMNHEIRAPLHTILGSLELMPPDDATDRHVARIATAAHHLVDLTGDLLDLAQLGSNHLQVAAETLELDRLVRSAVEVATFEPSRVVVTGASGLQVVADARRVVQVLVNLIGNAGRYAPPGSPVSVTTRRNGLLVEIVVADRGPGVDPGERERIFEPFVTGAGDAPTPVAGTTARSGGVGLGLAISRGLAEAMGGSLGLADEPVGATFVFSVPAADPTGALPPAGRLRRVLYVEDDAMNVELVDQIVAMRPDLVLEVRRTVVEGLVAARSDPPDVLLLDLHLPDGTGLDAMAALRADPATVDIPVVVVTADATTATADAVVARGAGLLTKPFTIAELFSAIDRPSARSSEPR